MKLKNRAGNIWIRKEKMDDHLVRAIDLRRICSEGSDDTRDYEVSIRRDGTCVWSF